MINSKSTKAQLLQYISELEEGIVAAEMEIVKLQPVPVRERLAAIGNEILAFGRDVYRLGAYCRKVSQPMLDKAILIVNNDRMGRSRSFDNLTN